jgi:hypothetical protein
MLQNLLAPLQIKIAACENVSHYCKLKLQPAITSRSIVNQNCSLQNCLATLQIKIARMQNLLATLRQDFATLQLPLQ